MMSSRFHNRGAALVIVLGMLVLVSIVAIGFFARTVTLRKSTANELASSSARSLADTAVNLVQAQIDHATTAGNFTSWASQPGAIRLYNTSGTLRTVYRLYSSSSLTTSTATDLAADLPSSPDWRNSKSLWVDLNAPVDISSNATLTRRFPILDPSSMGAIEGFNSNGTTSITVLTSNQTSRSLPMPVRWMYVLQNGEIVAPAAASGGTDSVTVAGASAANPIVGRIAFWADDNTSRLNINTAGGRGNAISSNATFWDTPRFEAPDERNLAKYQPASGEFQRYPGHPGTTTLGKVFPSLTSNQVLQLTPRYTYGGSRDATVANTANNTSKADRLLSSAGELLYTPDRSATPLLSADQLEGVKFLLTSHSRSPELTLFGTPRISVWPIHANAASAWRSPKDLLLARAATVNGNQTYHFTRSDSQSCTTDINLPRNLSLLNYLDHLTQQNIPGWGASFTTKYPADRRDILTKIFDYVRITNLQDPLLAPANRYSSNSSTSAGIVAPAIHPTWNTRGFGRFEVLADAGFLLVGVGQGNLTVNATTTNATVLTSQAGTLYDSGNSTSWANAASRLPADGKVAVQGLFLMSFFNPAMGYAETKSGFSLRIQGLNSATLDGVAMDFPADDWIYCDPAQNGTVNQPPGTRGFGAVIDSRKLIFYLQGGPKARSLGFGDLGRRTTYPFFSRNIIPVSANAPSVSFTAGNVTLALFSGNGAQNSEPQKWISTYTLDFSQLPGTIPTPKLARNRGFGLTASNAAEGGYQRDRFHLASNMLGSSTTSPQTSFYAGGYTYVCGLVEPDRDVFYTLAPSGNFTDYRLLNRAQVPAAAFNPHPNANGINRSAFLGMMGAGFQMAGSGPYGKLSQSASYYEPSIISNASGNLTLGNLTPNPAQPAVPSGLNGAFSANNSSVPGDWDNGMGIVMDGPYINKPDDGNQKNISTGIPFFDSDFYYAEILGGGLFSPNRMIPSAGMFGSLPTGVLSAQPWQTLLFRPGPLGHKGLESPRDHLLLDLFWMPVVEPYAISEPFSTAGKVNMNYQIQPFTYIDRKTPLLSVLDSERIAKVRRGDADKYKKLDIGIGSNARLPLNLSETDGTLRQFRERFAANEIFKSPTEICDVFLVPQGSSWSTDAAARTAWYGDDFGLVGDNTRERPYANLLGRVTTKSNTFTVYYTVQALKNPASLPQDIWNESKGVVMSEYRGNTTLERYINPNDTRIPDYAAVPSKIATDPLDKYYNWRIIEQTQFAP
ncbi:MAG: Verru_Chthon cassette protein A [Verrucomicrobia bacterium]|nr:Verru_Chthon cassette protein A [Verrucomicrobiota bacterium]